MPLSVNWKNHLGRNVLRVFDRYEQQADTFRIMKIEKIHILSILDLHPDDSLLQCHRFPVHAHY